MGNNLKYNAWLHWSVTNECNLNCEYCYTKSHLKRQKSPKINIPALLNTLDRTGKIFKISFTGGGEPFMVPNIIEACEELTKKHYIAFNSNLINIKVRDFAKRINPKKTTRIIASLHIRSLERLQLTDQFLNNYSLLQKCGFKMRTVSPAYPPLMKDLARYKKFFNENGITLYFDYFRGRYNNKEYPQSYTDNELKVFDLEQTNMNTRCKDEGVMCNAGYNVASVDPRGKMWLCNTVPQYICNIYKEIKFNNSLIKCSLKNCGCPLNSLDEQLHDKAMMETKKFTTMDKYEYIKCFYFYVKSFKKNNDFISYNPYQYFKTIALIGTYVKLIDNYIKFKEAYAVFIKKMAKDLDRRIGLAGIFIKKISPGLYSVLQMVKFKK